MWRALAMVAGLLCLAGCASELPSPLNPDKVKSLRLNDVVVTVAPDAEISWANAEHEFLVAHKASGAKPVKSADASPASLTDATTADAAEASALAASPAGKAFVHDKVAARLKAAFDTKLKPALQGGVRPVRLEVTVHAFSIPSALQRMALGGLPGMNATAVLKDAATGEVIVSQAKKNAFAMAGNGWGGVLLDQAFSDLDVRLAEAYADEYRRWLLHET